MLKYTVHRVIGSRLFIFLVKAQNSRAVLEKIKAASDVRSTAKLTRRQFREAGFVGVFLGRVLIFPVRKKRQYTAKKERQPHPRRIPRSVMLAA